MTETPRTDDLLLDLRFTPLRHRAEKLAELSCTLEIELQQANDAYTALREAFKVKEIEQ